MREPSELITIFPVFLLVDVSVSMAGAPIEALNKALPEMRRELQSAPTVGETVRIALVTFSDEARTVIPLSDLAHTEIPEVLIEGGTNFAAGLRGVRTAIEAGLGALPKGTPVYRPVVFFMSDGAHQAREDWGPALQQLRDPHWRFRPEVVSFGFNAAQDDALRQIATKFAFRAKDADPATQVRAIMTALTGTIATTSAGFRDATRAGGALHLETPPDHFTQLPPLTV
ncbi:VWA domain-containing protein [Dactylosporangium sp. NPDC051541]|uniref:vWA domain-containing protein n=1 Tax=Dactylosporangium sp. NPDC051541 TaxID=3363977 RepID=UPI003795332F